MKIINEDIGLDLILGFNNKKKKTKASTYPVNKYTVNLHRYINKIKKNKKN